MSNKESIDTAARMQLQKALAAAMQAHESGELFEADLFYAEALRVDPDHLRALRLRGILARERGDLDTALALLQRAHNLAPDASEVLDEIALTQMAGGELQAAENTLRLALALDSRSVKTQANLGALLQHRGHLQAAIDCYRQALALQPDDLYLQCNLAKALADAGKTTEALALSSAVIERSGRHPDALATHGAVLIDARDYAAAQAALAEATHLDPANDMALVNLALCHSELGEIRSAANILRAAVHANPFNARAVADLSNCLTALNTLRSAVDLCADFLQKHPGERLVIAAYALALHNDGQYAAARELTDSATLVKAIDLPCPAGFTNSAVFHTALAAAIRADASLLDNPVSKSTYGGAQTGELDLASTDSLRAFAMAIRQALHTATREWQQDLHNHPLLTSVSPDGFVRAWGTVLHAGGQQTPHMHPLGWLSGVYYVQLPESMTTTDEPQAGWLEFGELPERFYRATPLPTQRFEPVPGRLLLFPSWLWHRTLPFSANGERISIAFDVMPQAALRML